MALFRMARALIGYTGFVGGNLNRQAIFDDVYRSSNIDSIRGQHYELIVSAGISAVKWRANRESDTDRDHVHRLLHALEEVSADRFVLISTVDVYEDPSGVNEDTAIDVRALDPYGKHRREAELFVQQRFPQHCIIRLPGLFGPGLKKNMLYDLLVHSSQSHTHRASVFQFYDLNRLWSDMQIALDRSLPLVNFATEPVATTEIARVAFGVTFTNTTEKPPVSYDVHSNYAALFGGKGNYFSSKGEMLDRITAFVASARAVQSHAL